MTSLKNKDFKKILIKDLQEFFDDTLHGPYFYGEDPEAKKREKLLTRLSWWWRVYVGCKNVYCECSPGTKTQIFYN